MPYFARHFRVLTFDGRGNGKSDRPRGREAYGPEQFVGDALAVLDATHTDRAMVVAASPRAVVALRMAVDWPTRVSAAVFITPDLWPTEFLLRQFRLATQRTYADDEIFNPRYWRTDWPGFVERMAAVNLFPHPHSTRLREDFQTWALETDDETFEASVRASAFPDANARCSSPAASGAQRSCWRTVAARSARGSRAVPSPKRRVRGMSSSRGSARWSAADGLSH